MYLSNSKKFKSTRFLLRSENNRKNHNEDFHAYGRISHCYDDYDRDEEKTK